MELVFTGAAFFFFFFSLRGAGGYLLQQNSFKVVPDAGPWGVEGAGGQEGLGLGEAPAAPWPPGHKECSGEETGSTEELFRLGFISKILFPLHSQTYFSKQVLLISWNVGLLFGVSHTRF